MTAYKDDFSPWVEIPSTNTYGWPKWARPENGGIKYSPSCGVFDGDSFNKYDFDELNKLNPETNVLNRRGMLFEESDASWNYNVGAIRVYKTNKLYDMLSQGFVPYYPMLVAEPKTVDQGGIDTQPKDIDVTGRVYLRNGGSVTYYEGLRWSHATFDSGEDDIIGYKRLPNSRLANVLDDFDLPILIPASLIEEEIEIVPPIVGIDILGIF